MQAISSKKKFVEFPNRLSKYYWPVKSKAQMPRSCCPFKIDRTFRVSESQTWITGSRPICQKSAKKQKSKALCSH